jgi:hypothetical protein
LLEMFRQDAPNDFVGWDRGYRSLRNLAVRAGERKNALDDSNSCINCACMCGIAHTDGPQWYNYLTRGAIRTHEHGPGRAGASIWQRSAKGAAAPLTIHR